MARKDKLNFPVLTVKTFFVFFLLLYFFATNLCNFLINLLLKWRRGYYTVLEISSEKYSVRFEKEKKCIISDITAAQFLEREPEEDMGGQIPPVQW